MVLQIVADPRQFVDDRDAVLAQQFAGPTPESCSSCGDSSEPPDSNTSARARTRRGDAVLHEFETDRALAVEQHAVREGADFDGQVGPLHRRAQIGERGAAPPHLAHGQLVVADAFLLGAVEIGVGREPGLLRGGDKGVVQFVAGAQIGDVERAAGAVIIVRAALLVLGAAEIRQHVVIAPADAAELPPIVEILPLAADIDQPVDRLEPPSTLPRGHEMRRPSSPGTGSVSNCQVISGW